MFKRPKVENSLADLTSPETQPALPRLNLPDDVLVLIARYLDWDEASLFLMVSQNSALLAKKKFRRVLNSFPSRLNGFGQGMYVHAIDIHMETMQEALAVVQILRNSRRYIDTTKLSFGLKSIEIQAEYGLFDDFLANNPEILSFDKFRSAFLNFQTQDPEDDGKDLIFHHNRRLLYAGMDPRPHDWAPLIVFSPNLEEVELRPWGLTHIYSTLKVSEALSTYCPKLHSVAIGDESTQFAGNTEELKRSLCMIPSIQSVSVYQKDFMSLFDSMMSLKALLVAHAYPGRIGIWMDYSGTTQSHRATLLMYAVRKRSWVLVEEILRTLGGVPISATNLPGDPIGFAVLALSMSGFPDILQGISVFLSFGLDIGRCIELDHEKTDLRTPLWQELLLHSPTPEMFQVLFQRKFYKGFTAMEWSAQCNSGAFPLPSSILECCCRHDDHYLDSDYFTPLLESLFAHRPNIESELGLRCLIGKPTDTFGIHRSLLSVCTTTWMARFLLKHGADPNFTSPRDQMPLLWDLSPNVLEVVVSHPTTKVDIEYEGITLLEREFAKAEPSEAVLMTLLDRGIKLPTSTLTLEGCVTTWLANYFHAATKRLSISSASESQNHRGGPAHPPSSPPPSPPPMSPMTPPLQSIVKLESILRLLRLVDPPVRADTIAPAFVFCTAPLEHELLALLELLDTVGIYRIERSLFLLKRISLVDRAAFWGFAALLEFLLTKLSAMDLQKLHHTTGCFDPISSAIIGSIDAAPDRIDSFIRCAQICRDRGITSKRRVDLHDNLGHKWSKFFQTEEF